MNLLLHQSVLGVRLGKALIRRTYRMKFNSFIRLIIKILLLDDEEGDCCTERDLDGCLGIKI